MSHILTIFMLYLCNLMMTLVETSRNILLVILAIFKAEQVFLNIIYLYIYEYLFYDKILVQTARSQKERDKMGRHRVPLTSALKTR